MLHNPFMQMMGGPASTIGLELANFLLVDTDPSSRRARLCAA
jgi:hypothetical protein